MVRLPLTKADDRALMRHALGVPMRDERGKPIKDADGDVMSEPYPPNLLHIAKVIAQASYIPAEQRERLADDLEHTVLRRIQDHREGDA